MQGSDLDLCVTGAPGTQDYTTEPVRGNGNQIKALRNLIASLPHTIVVKEARLFKHIRVPILVLEFHAPSGQVVEADVSVGGSDERTGVQKGFTDQLIRRALTCMPRALPLVRLVKQWAKARGLNKAFEGYLNSLAWTLLGVFFFLSRGEASPNLLLDEAERAETASREAEETGALPGRLEATPCRPSHRDLADFFEAVASWGSRRGVSLLTGGDPEGYATGMSPFYIEDPGVKLATGRDENVARALRDGTWSTIRFQCAAAARALRQLGIPQHSVRAWAQESCSASRRTRAAPTCSPRLGGRRPRPGPPQTTTPPGRSGRSLGRGRTRRRTGAAQTPQAGTAWRRAARRIGGEEWPEEQHGDPEALGWRSDAAPTDEAPPPDAAAAGVPRARAARAGAPLPEPSAARFRPWARAGHAASAARSASALGAVAPSAD
ncbi:unnamed protein product [Prorocentrum cordatum]|uniref:Polynucleotide adenylyltransferase n=1 Tax=Prorocentrum cordatum TaxID=2364126 RepID=A0ABN9RHR5_9DINO|nr:unnamed protein product [Polarella glacialis]